MGTDTFHCLEKEVEVIYKMGQK